MFRRTKLCTGLMLAFGGTAVMTANVALAQATTPASEGQRVEITGSRIRSLSGESPSPLQVITAQDIAASGATNLQELLLRSPAMGGLPTFSRTNSNFDVANSGVSTVDLRNLGEERTLVLVNGKRFVAGIPGSSAVDLNAIPTDFIERIELLTGGSSSTYGSDAVAGVINIILKRDFQGLLIDASVGQSQEGDDKRSKFSLTWGANAEGGKGNVMMHFGYTKQGAVYSKDRAGNEIDNITDSAFTGDVRDIFSFTTPFFSSFAPQGRIFIDPGASTASRTFDAAGNIIPWSTNGPAGDGVGATGFNRQEFRTIAIPTDRYLFAAKGDYEFAQNHRAYLEGTYVATNTHARLEPFPLEAPNIYPASGAVPAEFLVNGVLVRNPVIPQGIFDLLTQRNADGALVYGFSRRLSEVGNRGADSHTDTFRAVSGVKGAVTSVWDYDAYAGYGVNKRAQTSGGQVNVLNFRNALEAVPDVNDVDGDGDTTEAICRDAEARAQGCVPINIFGFNTISPAALQYVGAPSLLSTYTTQKMFGATVSGEPFKLTAGPVAVAFGAEYRKEYSLSEFDPLQQAGLNAGNATPRTEGDFSVKEAFIEAKVPLLKDAPFAKALSVGGAVRAGKYSTVGSTLSWNAGAEWAVNSSLKFRVTRALSTRAPNIGELFSPPVQDFPAVVDPCVGVTAVTPGALADACRAAPGVLANIAANGAFTLNQADLQGTSGFDRGNPNLQEEKGHSTTIGLVFTPREMPLLSNVTFTADYFNIKVDDAIVSTPRQFILSQCYGGDASFCQFVTRRPAAVGANSAGSLAFVDSASTNSGGLATEGVDLTAQYADRVGPGRLNARVSWTYLKKGYLTPLPGSAPDQFAGEVGSPKNKGTLGLGYTWGPFGINTLLTYIGKSALDDQWLAGLCEIFDPVTGDCLQAPAPGSVKLPAKTYADMQLTYTQGKVQYYFGVDNVFNTKGPRCDTNALIGGENGGCVVGAGTFAGTYDAIGRRYYVGLRIGL